MPDENEIRTAQNGDPTLKILIEHLTGGTTPSFKSEGVKDFRSIWRRLYMENNILMKKSPNSVNHGVVVAPESKVSQILAHVHDGPSGCHYGISKCYYKLINRYYFPKLAVRLSGYIDRCEQCLKRKMPKRPPRPEIQPIVVDHLSIGSLISYDFKGPLPMSSKSTLYQCNNRFALVIIDHSTRYALAYPTPTMESGVIAEIILNHWIPRFGVPSMIISDRAKSFSGAVIRAIYKALQIEVSLTASYNPAANGLCEQVNRNISSLMRVLLNNDVENWPSKLNVVFSAYNSFPQTSTGYSPNYLVYGRELIEPLDTLLQHTGVEGAKANRAVNELEQRLRLRRQALEMLQAKFNKANEKVRVESAELADAPTFILGERVGFQAPAKGGKLLKAFETNHEIVKIISKSTYVIRSLESGFERVVNVRKLRKIKGQTVIPTAQAKDGISYVINSDSSSNDEAEDDICADSGGNDGWKKNPGDTLNSETDTGDSWGKRLRDRGKMKKPDRLQM